MAVRLMDGFKRVRDAWPVVESRAGRDLGEYIKGSYAVRFKEMVNGDAAAAEFAGKELESAQMLQDSVFKQKYKRATDTTFSGEAGEKYAADKLSTANQKVFNMPSFMDKLFGKKLPSQWNPKTASKD
eukprot:gene4834-7853_t